VSVYDPVAANNAKQHFASETALSFVEDQYDCVQDAACLVVVTEWKSFKEPNFERIKSSMKRSLIYDGRNLFSLKVMREAQFEYHSIGRPVVRV
jgi:UDPglucose 6-dehydrogenase